MGTDIQKGKKMTTGKIYPKISIVTPVFNQVEYLEETILSILNQNYPNLEYIIIDGGSTDGTVNIIRKYENRLTYWVSEPDLGQYDAINKGFEQSTGDIMGWLNGDDKLVSGALSSIAHIFSTRSEIEWLTTIFRVIWNQYGQATKCSCCNVGYNRDSFLKGAYLPGCGWYAYPFIQQESTFWRRTLWENTGGKIDISNKYAGDFQLWASFFQHADLYAANTLIGGFRKHANQKTEHGLEEYLREGKMIIFEYGGNPYGIIESHLRKYSHKIFRCHLSIIRVLPLKIRSLLVKMKFIYPIKKVEWVDNKWQIFTEYVI